MSPSTKAALNTQIAHMEKAGRTHLMQGFVQHGQVSTWQHCVRVATCAVGLAEALHLRVDQPQLVRAALLHDYFLYDWHEPNHTQHATMHPVFALRNAREDFDLTPLEENAIAAHMWPLPPGRVPKSREAWLICAADKWCSLGETLFMR